MVEARSAGRELNAQTGDTRTAMRLAGCFCAGGTAMSVAGILMPHSAQADIPGFSGIAVVCALLTGLCFATASRAPSWAPKILMAVASVLITLAVYFDGERSGGPAASNEIIYFWVAVYSAYFFNRRQLAFQVGLMSALYAVVMVAQDVGSIGLTRWMVVTAMLGLVAFLVRLLTERIEGLIERLEETARTDALTGLLNRRGFEERFASELARVQRGGGSLALIIGDLDGFKHVNDRLGHPAGDAALVRVAETLRRNHRSSDSVARLGGEEFALIAPDTDAHGAFALAEALRADVSTAVDGAAVELTISFGISSYPDDGVNAESLQLAADRALYLAKERGRNCTIAAWETDPRGSAPGFGLRVAEAG